MGAHDRSLKMRCVSKFYSKSGAKQSRWLELLGSTMAIDWYRKLRALVLCGLGFRLATDLRTWEWGPKEELEGGPGSADTAGRGMQDLIDKLAVLLTGAASRVTAGMSNKWRINAGGLSVILMASWGRSPISSVNLFLISTHGLRGHPNTTSDMWNSWYPSAVFSRLPKFTHQSANAGKNALFSCKSAF